MLRILGVTGFLTRWRLVANKPITVDLHNYANFFHLKDTIYFKALQSLYQHIGACMALATEKKGGGIIAQSDSPGLVPSLSLGANPSFARGLSPRLPPPTLLCTEYDNFQQVWVYVNWLFVQPQGHQQGTSWLELSILFELL